MPSLRATIFAASIAAFSFAAPLSALADTSTSLPPLSTVSAPTIAAIKGSAVVKLDGCTLTGSSGRSASFSSKMEAGSSAAMQLRFDLYVRPISGGDWTLVKGLPKFGIWDRPSSSSVVWSKSVGGLTAGQSYRVVVTHQWLSKSGRAIRRVMLASPVCDQPDAHADLAASFIGSKTLASGKVVYMLLIRNFGLSDARGFNVTMAVNSIELPLVRVTSLGGGKSRVVTFTAAACASGSKITAEADFSKEIAEPNELNNVVMIACAAIGG